MARLIEPLHNQLASPWTTYRVGGPMDTAYFPTSAEACISVFKTVLEQKQSLTLLGWGSNSIVASQGIRGATLITRKLVGVRQLDVQRFEVEAGVHLAKIATLAQQHGLSGGEYMIGIPATLGGAVVMNAGAMGQETSQVVESVSLYNLSTQAVEVWSPAQLGYAYRHSQLDPRHHVVLSAILRFTPGHTDTIVQTMRDNVAFRKAHHPVEPNGGSVFQNPDKTHTVGRMLDDLNAKGWQVGGMMISPRHANFIINANNGSSTELLKLMCRMKQAVKQHYGFIIQPENRLLGDISPEEAALWSELQAK